MGEVNFQSQFPAFSSLSSAIAAGQAPWETGGGNPYNGGGGGATATAGSGSSGGSNSGSNDDGNSGSPGDSTSTPAIFSTSKSSGTPKHTILAIVLPIALIIAAAIFFVAMWAYYRRKRAAMPALQQKGEAGREKPTEYYQRDAEDPVR